MLFLSMLFFTPLLPKSSLLLLPSLLFTPSSFSPKIRHLHGTPRLGCQWESVMWRKSVYFVSSRSDAEPVDRLNSTSLPPNCCVFYFEGCIFSLSLSFCRHSFIPARQPCSKIQAVNTERCHSLFFRWHMLYWDSRFSLYLDLSDPVSLCLCRCVEVC